MKERFLIWVLQWLTCLPGRANVWVWALKSLWVEIFKSIKYKDDEAWKISYITGHIWASRISQEAVWQQKLDFSLVFIPPPTSGVRYHHMWGDETGVKITCSSSEEGWYPPPFFNRFLQASKVITKMKTETQDSASQEPSWFPWCQNRISTESSHWSFQNGTFFPL